MKKVLIGCGVVVALLLALGGVLIWKGIGLAKRAGEKMAEVSAVYDETDKAFPFQQPSDGLLAADRLDVWLKVREAVAKAADSVTGPLNSGKKPGMVAAMGAGLSMFTDIPLAHAKALKENQMSLQEHNWILAYVAGALQSAQAAADPDTKSLATEWKTLGANQPTGANQAPVTAAVLTSSQIDHALKLIKTREKQFRAASSATIVDGMSSMMQKSSAVRSSRTTPARSSLPVSAELPAPGSLPASAPAMAQ